MTRRARYWQTLMREQERSGVTQAAFCRQRGINPGTFAWWRRKLRAGTDGTGSARRRAPRQSSPRPGTAESSWVMATGRSGSTRSEHRASAPDPLRFMEVGVVGSGPRHYEIELPGGRVVRVPADFDPGHVTRLILAVEAAC